MSQDRINVQKLMECDTNRSFAFISYSWKDADAVYRDVHHFQNMGYNIWIDKKKMSAQEDAWDNQAREAIHDIDCKVLFFYMSKDSVSSDSCLKELQAAVDDESVAVHGGPLKVVLVEAEPIPDDVPGWLDELHSAINGDREIPKKIRTSRCRTIAAIKKEFFEGRNWKNKIRIRPQANEADAGCEAAGESDYDQQLLDCLPEITEPSEEPQYYSESRGRLIEKLRSSGTNVRLTTKDKTESPDLPFYERLYGVKELTLLNFAGTSFIAGIDIARVYHQSEGLRQWFEKGITEGTISARVILTNPLSYAAKDAENYKMYPPKQVTEQKNIIRMNLNILVNFMRKYPQADLKVYVTDIALPYGIMLAENYQDPKYNYMKVDLYAPVTMTDNNRPSFYLMRSEEEQREMYDLFLENLNRIRREYATEVLELRKADWLTKAPIIHRGRSMETAVEHTRSAYRTCILHGYPMEVDLLEMADGELVVCRDQEIMTEYGSKKLSKYRLKELLELLDEESIDPSVVPVVDGLMTFREFLRYVDGRVDLLVELKDFVEDPTHSCHHKLADRVVDALQGYRGRLAIHSANPYVLKEIRGINCLIPVGQISLDYETIEGVGEAYRQMHLSMDYLDIVEPDFISYSLETMMRRTDLREEVAQVCRERRIPLLAWTIHSSKEKRRAMTVCGCDNYIVEGAPGF